MSARRRITCWFRWGGLLGLAAAAGCSASSGGSPFGTDAGDSGGIAPDSSPGGMGGMGGSGGLPGAGGSGSAGGASGGGTGAGGATGSGGSAGTASGGSSGSPDAGGEPDASCPGYFEASQRQCWALPDDDAMRTWQEAVDYCEELTAGDGEDYHLPTVDDLRALILDCPSAALGGSCPVTDGSSSAAATTDCQACDPRAGGNCYWRLDSDEPCNSFFWSASEVADYAEAAAWFVYYRDGSVNWESKLESFGTLCVRSVD